jgi:hypothetical protein
MYFISELCAWRHRSPICVILFTYIGSCCKVAWLACLHWHTKMGRWGWPGEGMFHGLLGRLGAPAKFLAETFLCEVARCTPVAILRYSNLLLTCSTANWFCVGLHLYPGMIHLKSELNDGLVLVLFKVLEGGNIWMEMKPEAYILLKNFYLRRVKLI